MKCNKDLSECTCDDLQERLMSLGGPGGVLVYRMCKKCKKHYAKCTCEKPEWVLSSEVEESECLQKGKASA